MTRYLCLKDTLHLNERIYNSPINRLSTSYINESYFNKDNYR